MFSYSFNQINNNESINVTNKLYNKIAILIWYFTMLFADYYFLE